MSATDSWPSKTFNASASDIRGLVLGKSAFIYEAPTGVDVISAVVRSESQRIVDGIVFTSVTTSAGIKALEVDLQQTWANTFWFWSGDYVIDIYVPSSVLQLVVFDGCGHVVVHPRVLGTMSVDVKLTGSGNVFIQDSPMSLDRLNLDVSGSGRIQVDVPSVSSALGASISGSGEVVVSATTIDGPTVRADVSGSGDIYILATKSLHATSTLTTSISGSGRVTLADVGSCGQHDAKVSGSGTIQAGAVVCQSTNATLSGSGSMYLSSVESISVDKSGSGSIAVVGRSPARVSGAIEVAASNPVTRMALHNAPAHTASHLTEMGSGLNAILGVLFVVALVFVIKKGCRRWCRHRRCRLQQQEGEINESPYGVAMTPVVVVEVVPDAHNAKGIPLATGKLV